MEKRTKKFDRRAWIRILEAFLAILLITGSMIVMLNKKAPETDIGSEIYAKQRQILDIISKNDSLRNDVITSDNTRINEAISKLAPNSWNFTTSICDINSMECINTAAETDPALYEKNVYATEVLITSNLTYYSPKKLRFFVWMK